MQDSNRVCLKLLFPPSMFLSTLSYLCLQFDGRKMQEEDIMFGNGAKVKSGPNADWGRAATTSNVITAVPLRNWVVMYTRRDQTKANDFIGTIMKCAPQMGIECRNPDRFELKDDRVETYIRAIREHMNPAVWPRLAKILLTELFGDLIDLTCFEINIYEHDCLLYIFQLQIIVAICPTSRDDRYSAIKKTCCVDLPIPSQVIIGKTIGDPKKLRSVCQKIALQMNCKLGGELWGVPIPLVSGTYGFMDNL